MLKFQAVLLAILFFTSLQTYAQRLNQKELEQYYPLLNQAELSICNGDLPLSFSNYSAAFKLRGNNMSSKHLYNFFAVSADLGKWDDCRVLLTEMKKRGWEYSSFKNSIAAFDASAASKLNKLYLQLTDIPVELDSNYVAIIDSLFDVDQKTNKHLRSLNLGNLDVKSRDSLDHLTRNNLQFMHQIFSKKFPSDKTIGRYIVPWGRLQYYIIFTHNTQLSNYHYLDSLLYQGVLTGDFAPEEFDYWISAHHRDQGKDTIINLHGRNVTIPLFPYDFVSCNDSLFQFPAVQEKIVQCDNNRKTITGLCTVEELRTKIIYQYYHPKFHFVEMEYVLHFDVEIPALTKKLLHVKDI